jgi:hypothetical protein
MTYTPPGFRYEQATSDDDAQLRALVARNPVPGMIAVAYCREPSFFAACDVAGDQWQVGVCREEATGNVVGLAQRSSRLMYINGEPQRVAYISALRVDSDYQGRGITRGGFAYARQMHEADPLPTITTIIELNKKARAILERPRDPFPHYLDIGRVYTLALTALFRPPRTPLPDVTIKRSKNSNLDAVVAFLNSEATRRQFGYHYTVDDFINGRLRDFDISGLFIAMRGGEIVGTMGYWSQSGFKQTVITGYHPLMRAAKPFYDTWQRVRGGASLPRPGQTLPHSYVTLAAVRDDDAVVFDALLHRVMRLAYDQKDAYMMLGLHEQDPLLSVAQRFPHIAYRSRLYVVTWKEEEQAFYDELDDRIPHIEIATL